MRFLKTILVVVTMSSFIWISVSNVKAGTYIGDFCWEFEFPIEEETITGIMQVAVTDMGNGHFFLNGKMSHTEEGETIIQAIHGNAEIAGDKVYVTVQSALRIPDDGMGAYTEYIVLDWPSLNGTIELLGIWHEYDPEATEPTELEYLGPGTVTFIECP